MRYSYRRVASDPRLLKLEQQKDPRGRLFVKALYGNVDPRKLEAFVDEDKSTATIKSVAIPQRASVLEDFTYPILTKLLANFEGEVEPEYDFLGLGGRVAGTWDMERKTLSLQFIVQG